MVDDDYDGSICLSLEIGTSSILLLPPHVSCLTKKHFLSLSFLSFLVQIASLPWQSYLAWATLASCPSVPHAPASLVFPLLASCRPYTPLRLPDILFDRRPPLPQPRRLQIILLLTAKCPSPPHPPRLVVTTRPEPPLRDQGNARALPSRPRRNLRPTPFPLSLLPAKTPGHPRLLARPRLLV